MLGASRGEKEPESRPYVRSGRSLALSSLVSLVWLGIAIYASVMLISGGCCAPASSRVRYLTMIIGGVLIALWRGLRNVREARLLLTRRARPRP
jgi:hypothetical protein